MQRTWVGKKKPNGIPSLHDCRPSRQVVEADTAEVDGIRSQLETNCCFLTSIWANTGSRVSRVPKSVSNRRKDFGDFVKLMKQKARSKMLCSIKTTWGEAVS